MLVRRSVKISLKWVGVRDRRRLCALIEAYRAAVNFYIRLLWSDPTATFSTATSKRLVRTRLSARYCDQALKQAVEIVSSTRKSVTPPGVTPTRPFFKGSAILDAKFVRIEFGSGEFNLSVRVSSLQKRKRVVIRSKRTGVLQKWLAMPGARLVEGCALDGGDLLTLWVEFPAPAIRLEGPVLGVDVGVTRLLATSDGVLLGTEFRAVRDKVRRRKPGSKGRRRARRERDDLVCVATKRLPWDGIRAVAFEDLTGIKSGKRRGRYRSFRRAIAAWRPPFVAKRMSCLAVEHGVLAIPVAARGNSTTCPECQHRSSKNRRGSIFRCLRCGHETDADLLGALAAKRRGEARFDERLEAWERECALDQDRRERRLEAAERRGQAMAEKWRRRRESAPAQEVQGPERAPETEASSDGAQLPAAHAPNGHAPTRNQTCGGAPDENPEAGAPHERRQAAGRRGEEPFERAPPRPQGQLPSCSRVLALDERPPNPSRVKPVATEAAEDPAASR